MTDIAVIILQKNEILHIGRCLDRLRSLEPRQVFVVDCFSTDGSDVEVEKIAETDEWKGRLSLVRHEWPGNQAAQFNWALDNLSIRATWVLRLDADEYLTPELVNELKSLLVGDIAFKGLAFPLARTWKGSLLKHEAGHVVIPRMFKRGYGRYDSREMDEKIVIDGEVVRMKNCFVDDNLKPFDWWKAKHRAYAKKEARVEVEENRNLKGVCVELLTPAQRNKARYRKLPLFIRPFIYAFYRYFAWDVWRDGWAGLSWTVWQGVWYRLHVDLEILHLKIGV